MFITSSGCKTEASVHYWLALMDSCLLFSAILSICLPEKSTWCGK